MFERHLMLTEKVDEQGRPLSSQFFQRYDHLNKQHNNSPTKDLSDLDYAIHIRDSSSFNRKVLFNEPKLAAIFPRRSVGRGRASSSSKVKKFKRSPIRRPGRGLHVYRRNSSRAIINSPCRKARLADKENDILSNLTRYRMGKVDDDIASKQTMRYQKEQLRNIFDSHSIHAAYPSTNPPCPVSSPRSATPPTPTNIHNSAISSYPPNPNPLPAIPPNSNLPSLQCSNSVDDV